MFAIYVLLFNIDSKMVYLTSRHIIDINLDKNNIETPNHPTAMILTPLPQEKM